MSTGATGGQVYEYDATDDSGQTITDMDEVQAAIVRYPDCSAFSPRIADELGRVENRDSNFVERADAERLVRLRAPFAGDCCIHFLHGGAFVMRRATFLAAEAQPAHFRRPAQPVRSSPLFPWA